MDHLNRIVDQLLGFAKSTEPTADPLDINELLNDVLLLSRHRLSQHGISLKKRFAANLPCVQADRVQMEQACLNLILNAADAMPRGGTLTVTTSLQPPSSVALTFTDTGVGMDAEHRGRLFEPFLTTRASGTGLGLPIVSRIVEAHHGRIEVKSAPRRGTTFRIVLPV